MCLKDAVKVTYIAVSDRIANLIYMKLGVFQIICCLHKPLFLQKLFVSFTCTAFDLPTEPKKVIMKSACNLRETSAAIIFFNIVQNTDNGSFFCGLGGQPVRMIHKLHEKQTHGGLTDASAIGGRIAQQ